MDSRAPLDPGRVYLGWQHALVHPDPGPPPKRPTPPEQQRVHPEWMDAQRREESQLNRPLEVVGGLALGMAVFLVILSWPLSVIPGWGAAVVIGVCLVLAGVAAYAVWQGEQALRVRLADERERLERRRADRERRLHVAQEDHARRFDAWRASKAAYDAQHEWYAVELPRGVRRLDVAGGTRHGWQALVTTMGASCLDAGADVTAVDLSGGAVAADLTRLAADHDPQVWVLPQDLPSLHIGTSLDAEAFCDVLSLTAGVGESPDGPRDPGVDRAILERILDVLGGRASIGHLAAALRAVAGIGDGRDDVDRGLVAREQLDRLGSIFGRGGADRLVSERAWALESQLRKLDSVGTEAASRGHAPLRVMATTASGGSPIGGVLSTYVTTALAQELRATPQRKPWSHALFVCGAEQLCGDALDRLYDACEVTGTGLVAMYRSIPAQVRTRLGRGEAAVAFMRPGNAEDAKVVSEHIGAGQRLMVNQLTESLGAAATAGDADSYTSTQGGDRPAGPDRSSTGRHTLDDDAVTTRTSWGRDTAQALRDAESLSHTMGRSRYFRAEPSELQRLPASAFVLSWGAGAARTLVCGDANPAIVSLPQATRSPLTEVSRQGQAGPMHGAAAPADSPQRQASGWAEPHDAYARHSSAVGAVQGPASQPAHAARSSPVGETWSASGPAGGRDPVGATPQGTRTREDLADLPPNLGPPPERLDWRERR